jgi:hypothetical protein
MGSYTSTLVKRLNFQKFMNTEVEHLSNSFRTDADHLLIKVHCANNPNKSPNLRTSYIAKLVVDVYMSCECALKSMIASSSHDKSGVEVYAAILKYRHNLWCLVKHANPKKLNKDDKKILQQVSKLGVSLRYSLDLFSLTTCEFLPNDKVNFKIDQAYLKNFLAVAKLLTDEANERHKKKFDTGRTNHWNKDTHVNVEKFVEKLRAVSKKQSKK